MTRRSFLQSLAALLALAVPVAAVTTAVSKPPIEVGSYAEFTENGKTERYKVQSVSLTDTGYSFLCVAWQTADEARNG